MAREGARPAHPLDRQPDRAIPYYRRAATVARQVYANAEAIGYYRHLLDTELVQRLSPLEMSGLMLDLGKVWQLTGQWTRAMEIYRKALTHAESVGDLKAQGECQQALGDVVRLRGITTRPCNGLQGRGTASTRRASWQVC